MEISLDSCLNPNNKLSYTVEMAVYKAENMNANANKTWEIWKAA